MRKLLISTFLVFSLCGFTAEATEFFSDGFESGDFSEWDGSFGNIAVVTDQKNSGTYAAKLTINSSSDPDSTPLKKLRAAEWPQNVFIRWYMRMSDDYAVPGQHKHIKWRASVGAPQSLGNYFGTTFIMRPFGQYEIATGYEGKGLVRDAQFGSRWSESLGFKQNGDLDYTVNTNTNITLQRERWYGIEMEVFLNNLGASDAEADDGYIKIWVDNDLKFHVSDMNIRAHNQSFLFDELLVMGVFQPNPSGSDEYEIWFDDFVIADEKIGLIGAGDTSPPFVDTLSPDISETNVLTTSDVVMHIKDTGDGVDESTIMVTIEGTDVTDRATITGTGADKTLTLSNQLTTFNYLQVIDIAVNASDTVPNAMTQYDYTFTIESQPTAGGTVFGSGDLNDFANYTALNASRWSVVDQGGGDNVLQINTTDFPNNGEAPGEYVLYNNTTYTEFDLSYKFTSTENQATNAFVDHVTIIFYQDENNYAYILWNKDTTPSFEVFSFKDGFRTQRGFSTTSVLADNSEHTLRVKWEDSVLRVFYDGTEEITIDNYDFAQFGAGQIGFGGYNDAGEIDDITIQILTPSQETASPTRWIANFVGSNIRLDGVTIGLVLFAGIAWILLR